MTTYELTASQVVPLDIDRAWDFFSDPRNLARITPPGFGFVIHTAEPKAESGSRIEYTVRPVAGIPLRWRTRLEDVDRPNGFTDVQEAGPYAHWVHTHTLTPVDGGGRGRDRVRGLGDRPRASSPGSPRRRGVVARRGSPGPAPR